MRTLIVCFLFTLPLVVAAQSQNRAVHSYPLLSDKNIKQSPYTLSKKTDFSLSAAGVVLSGFGYYLMRNNALPNYTSQDLAGLDRNSVNTFDRSATSKWSPNADIASDVFLATSISLPLFLLFDEKIRPQTMQVLVMGAEVTLLNIGLTLTTKYTVRRTRPFVYNSELDEHIRLEDDSRESFYSGHTSVAASYSFFFAQVLTDFNPNMSRGGKIATWSTAAIIPGVTGYLRYAAGRHYPTDILVGYATGALCGWAVPFLHKVQTPGVQLQLHPAHLFGLNGLGVTARF